MPTAAHALTAKPAPKVSVSLLISPSVQPAILARIVVLFALLESVSPNSSQPVLEMMDAPRIIHARLVSASPQLSQPVQETRTAVPRRIALEAFAFPTSSLSVPQPRTAAQPPPATPESVSLKSWILAPRIPTAKAVSSALQLDIVFPKSSPLARTTPSALPLKPAPSDSACLTSSRFARILATVSPPRTAFREFALTTISLFVPATTYVEQTSPVWLASVFPPSCHPARLIQTATTHLSVQLWDTVFQRLSRVVPPIQAAMKEMPAPLASVFPRCCHPVRLTRTVAAARTVCWASAFPTYYLFVQTETNALPVRPAREVYASPLFCRLARRIQTATAP